MGSSDWNNHRGAGSELNSQESLAIRARETRITDIAFPRPAPTTRLSTKYLRRMVAKGGIEPPVRVVDVLSREIRCSCGTCPVPNRIGLPIAASVGHASNGCVLAS